MHTRQQQDAGIIYEQVSKVDSNLKTQYARAVYRFPILVRINGLQQTLGFYLGKATGDSGKGEKFFLEHLCKVLKLEGSYPASRVSTMALEEYLHCSRRCLEVAIWYRRFVESLLKVDITSIDADQNEKLEDAYYD